MADNILYIYIRPTLKYTVETYIATPFVELLQYPVNLSTVPSLTSV